MHAAGLSFVSWIMLLAIGGGAGLPLGIPPGPEDPLMSKVAPEECLFYATWSGTAEPDAQSDNRVERLLAEPEVRQFIAEVERRVKAAVRDQAEREGPQAQKLAEDATKWAETLLSSPTAMFVSDVKVTPAGPDIRAGALVNVGQDAPQLRASLEEYQRAFLGEAAQPVEIDGATWHRITPPAPNAPTITWGTKGKYLLVGIGEGSIEGMLERGRTPMPDWLAELRGQLPVARRSTMAYVNVRALIDRVGPLAGGPRVAALLDVAGLGNVTSLAATTGLDEDGFLSRTLLATDGEPQGLLSLVAGKPLGPAELAAVPADATIAMAARIDADQILETVLSVAEKIDPRAREEVVEGFTRMGQELGFDVRQDVLRSLGDSWCVYNSPGEGGLVITGLTAVIQVNDSRRLADAHGKFLAALRLQLQRHESRRRGAQIKQFQFAGQDVFFFDTRDSEFPLAPCWCLTDKELIVATMPQNVKAYLSRGPDSKSLATVPEVAELLGSAQGPTALCYTDTPKLFELAYPLLTMVARAATAEMQRQGLDIDVSLLPSAPAIGKHLQPDVVMVRHSEAGIEVVGRRSLPGGNIATTAPVGVALLLPAVQAAREAARRAQSMNNLKQISLALHNHHEALGAFPPAYSTDNSGKPLLSWRVAILPYVESHTLYRQFKLDEPWDSEHNQKLIERMPHVFKAAGSNAGPGKTVYLGVRGEDTVFPGEKKISMRDIRDGTSNTVMVVEASDARAVPWTKPDDYQYDEDDPTAGLVGLRAGGFSAAFCDGSVHFLSEAIDRTVLKALFTRSGGEVIGRDAY